MSKRKKVSDEQFVEAYGNLWTDFDKLTQTQKDNRNILRKVTGKYRKVLTDDEIQECSLEAMWKCLGYHENDKGQKFTTSLWRFAKWECNRKIKTKKAFNRKSGISLDNVEAPVNYVNEDMLYINDYLEILPENHKNFIVDYYFNRLTMEEIAKKHNFSKESARQKINKATRYLYEICTQSV